MLENWIFGIIDKLYFICYFEYGSNLVTWMFASTSSDCKKEIKTTGGEA